ncbi:hypothetical protein [Actinoplanes regularis]|uniref:Uncharacterized protein n=1 Tax=Actinoplanes regularis TaxID=52697 RepID=A0A239BQ84_9ACTN|nr:hypothetical protein [Actinoplanes regularis]GIE88406.1 hypothetical protein Are01nite_48860 [Actinoplanes regularis]SNS09194.1 hypothetical protein SAMN06264365_11015 [Actinoplanes regularis]
MAYAISDTPAIYAIPGAVGGMGGENASRVTVPCKPGGMATPKRIAAEFLRTFWLVFAGATRA